MSRTKASQQPPIKPKFDTKPYERPGLTSADILEIKESFDIFDREHIGLINPKELRGALSALGPEARNQAIYQVILDFDAEGAGYITFQQFIHLLTPRLLPDDSQQNINRIFALFDIEKTGFITIKDLHRVAHQLGEDLTTEDLLEMIGRADVDKDGVISREEFYNLLNGPSRQ